MGYPNFGNVKTLVLPIPSERMSIDDYKEKYGINLRKLLKLHPEDGAITLETNALVLIRDIDGTLHVQGSPSDGYSWEGSIFPAVCVNQQLYVEGENIGGLSIGGINDTENGVFGIGFYVESGVEFTIENMYVQAAIN